MDFGEGRIEAVVFVTFFAVALLEFVATVGVLVLSDDDDGGAVSEAVDDLSSQPTSLPSTLLLVGEGWDKGEGDEG